MVSHWRAVFIVILYGACKHNYLAKALRRSGRQRIVAAIVAGWIRIIPFSLWQKKTSPLFPFFKTAVSPKREVASLKTSIYIDLFMALCERRTMVGWYIWQFSRLRAVKVALVERQHSILCPFAKPTCWSHKWVLGEGMFRPAPAFSTLVRMSQWAHKQLLLYGHWESHWIIVLAGWICNNDSLEVLTGWGPERGN